MNPRNYLPIPKQTRKVHCSTLSELAFRGAAVLGVVLLVSSCSHIEGESNASDRYVPTITIDGQPLLFPPRTQTWTELRADQSCDRHVNDDITLQWAGFTTPKETSATNPYGIRSTVKVEIAAVTPVARPGIEDIEIAVDKTSLRPDGPDGPDSGVYSAHGDYSETAGSMKHVVVTETTAGYEIRADDAKWLYSDARVHSDVHAVTINFPCRK